MSVATITLIAEVGDASHAEDALTFIEASILIALADTWGRSHPEAAAACRKLSGVLSYAVDLLEATS